MAHRMNAAEPLSERHCAFARRHHHVPARVPVIPVCHSPGKVIHHSLEAIQPDSCSGRIHYWSQVGLDAVGHRIHPGCSGQRFW